MVTIGSSQTLANEAALRVGLGSTILASKLVHAFAVAGAIVGRILAVLTRGEALGDHLASGSLQGTLSRTGDGGLGRGGGIVRAANKIVDHNGLGVEAAAEIGAGGSLDAPLVELGRTAGLGHEDEKGLEIAGGDELV